MIDERDWYAEVEFMDELQQYLDSKDQHDRNLARIIENGPVTFIEIEAKDQTSQHEAKLQANGFTLCFSYQDVDTPDGATVNVWTKPSMQTMGIEFDRLNDTILMK